MEINFKPAEPNEADEIHSILTEAANWLDQKGETLWREQHLNIEDITAQVKNSLFWLVKADGETAGCVRFQNEDQEYWDDVPHEDSAFIHRVAVRRKFSGGGISKAIIDWAKEKAAREGKTFLRLDCAKREKLCRVYESHGFEFHSEKVREPYLVVRYEFKLT